jgi:hypothetical protein
MAVLVALFPPKICSPVLHGLAKLSRTGTPSTTVLFSANCTRAWVVFFWFFWFF